MRFLVDAQLPRRLARRLQDSGFDTLHTLDLAAGNRSPDSDVSDRADRDDRIVVTKDADFVTTFIMVSQPRLLLLVSTGNIDNADLEALLIGHISALASAFEHHHFVELTRAGIVIHR